LRLRLSDRLDKINYEYDTETVFNIFHDSLVSSIKDSTTVKNIKINHKFKKRSPCASKELIKLTIEKEQIYKIFKKFPINNSLKIKLKKISKEVIKKSRMDKKSYHNKLLNDQKKNMKSRAEKLEPARDHNPENPIKIDKLQPNPKLEPTKIKTETKPRTNTYLNPNPELEPQKNESVWVHFKKFCVSKKVRYFLVLSLATLHSTINLTFY